MKTKLRILIYLSLIAILIINVFTTLQSEFKFTITGMLLGMMIVIVVLQDTIIEYFSRNNKPNTTEVGCTTNEDIKVNLTTYLKDCRCIYYTSTPNINNFKEIKRILGRSLKEHNICETTDIKTFVNCITYKNGKYIVIKYIGGSISIYEEIV